MKTKLSTISTSTLGHPPATAWRRLFSLALCLLAGAAMQVHGGVLYSANFDSGNDGYTYTADVNSTSNLWHRTSIRSASPGFSQYYGLDATTNYNTGLRNAGNLQSPVISIVGAFPPVKLSFNYALQTESNTGFDQATVSVSTNGGTNWIMLADRTSGNPLTQGTSFHAWTGDLSAYAGSSIMLQFNFDTIDSAINSSQGWFVDDVAIESALAAAYVRSTNSLPWGGVENETAMTTVFGTNWSDLRFETSNPATLFSGGTRFIFMDGSENNALEMAAFLAANRVAISNWVAAGGSLYLNAAPNEGGNIDFGFGITLINGVTTSSALAANPAHPIFNGPFTPVGTSFTGGSFGHAVISGTNLTALLTNASQTLPILAEKPFRFGHVICGGMTTPSWAHSPQPQSSNLVANIIAYGAALGRTPARPQVAVFDNPLYVDTAGGSSAESDTVQASLTNLGFAVVTFTNIIEAAAASNVLLIPELEAGDLAAALTAAERSALSNRVVSGGTMIVHGRLTRASGLINSVLGLSVVEVSTSSSNNLTAAAIGTQFADDASSIPNLSGTRALQKTSLPPGSRSIYETNGLSVVAEMYVGAGKVIYLGWDWFNAAPLGAEDGGWLQVLESAVLERSLTPFYDDFDTDTDLGQWSSFGGVPGSTVLATNFGGSISGANALWFGNAGSRFAASRSLNTLGGGTVDFWIRLGNASNPWDSVELPAEGVVLEYSNDAGGIWVEMGRYDTATYRNWTHVVEDILPVAQTANTRFRWRQLQNTGPTFDHWALDNVGVFGPRGPAIVTQPDSVTVAHGGNVTFSVTASGSAPLYYFWRRNGAVIAGANSPGYTTNNVSLSDSGALFSCIVSNTFGTATSSNATLTVTALGLVSIPSGNVAESNALATTLPTLGFNVQVITQGQWTAGSIVVGYPSMGISGPSLGDIANGVRFIKISDHGADWTANDWSSLVEGTNITMLLGTAHPITSGLPASWTAKGFWRYGLPSEDFVGWSTEVALPSLVSVTNPVSQSRVLVAKTIGMGRAVYIGWNVYGPDAGPNDLAVLRNAILWSDTPVTSPALTSQFDAGLNTLTLSWPEAGFRLQSQTNSRATGLSNNWVNFPGGATSPVVITPNATNPAVFFRLVTP